MFKKFFFYYIIFIIFFAIYGNTIYFTNNISKNSNTIINKNEDILYFVSTASTKLLWPTPGFHTITSKFGNRISPITKKESFHYGIDIGAQEGSLIYSAEKGKVSFIGFNGANGYSIHITNNEFTYVYGHVSPNYIIKINDLISKRSNYSEMLVQNMFQKAITTLIQIQLGNSTNGSTTGPHLHFSIKKDGKAVNPLEYF